MQNETKSSEVKQQIANGFKLATYHSIDDKSLLALLELYNTAYNQFFNNPSKTCETVGGMSARTTAQTAALVVVANAMLNLDEVVTKN